MVPRRPSIVAACLIAFVSTVAFVGCNDKKQGVDEPAREGLSLPLGGIDYNVFITRELNPDIPPDNAYYSGPPAPKGETLYGIFIQACNHSNSPRTPASNFSVKDNQDNTYQPVDLPTDNPFAYHPRRLDPDQCIPQAGSVAQLGPSAGALLVFRFPLATTENRPLELVIEDSRAERLTFELDI